MQPVYTLQRPLHRLVFAVGAAMTLVTLASCGRHAIIHVAPREDGRPGAGTRDDPYGDLARAVSVAPDKATLLLAPGDYQLAASDDDDPGNTVNATVGLLIKGKSLHIQGAGSRSTTIHTHAGHGILFEDSAYSGLQDLGVTNGAPDTDVDATDAAILARRGQLALVGVLVFEGRTVPAGGPAATTGISAVAGCEGSRLVIRNSELMSRSGDGVVLFDGAEAVIEETLIDGVDLRPDGAARGGRDAGVRLIGQARATLLNSVVRRHWSGIQLIGDADAEIHGNVIEEIAATGVAIQDDRGAGRPGARVQDNLIYRTGGCGVWISASLGKPGGQFTGNVLLDAGDDAGLPAGPGESCGAAAGIDVQAAPAGFVVEKNLSYGVRESSGSSEFDRLQSRLCSNLASLRHGARTTFHARFCAAGAARDPV
jgi:hypothetical protein